jgi:cardiolipin synthase
MVVDGRDGFTGGVGIAAEWEGAARDPTEWRDTHFRVRGPAVLGLRATFLDNWIETTHAAAVTLDTLCPAEPAGTLCVQVMRSTAGVGWSDVATLHEVLIRLAERRLRFVTPYFSPSAETTTRLLEAVERGVEVEIMIPGPHVDKRVSELASSDEIERLLEGGVRLYSFQPTMLHKKCVTVDGIFASVGSANLNHRSSVKDDEIMLNVADRGFAGEMDRHFDADAKRCRSIGPGEWRRRGAFRRAVEGAASLVKTET